MRSRSAAAAIAEADLHHADILTPSWRVRQYPRAVRSPATTPQALDEDGDVVLVAEEPEPSAKVDAESRPDSGITPTDPEDDDTDSSDEAYVRRHEALAIEERRRWTGAVATSAPPGSSGIEKQSNLSNRVDATGGRDSVAPSRVTSPTLGGPGSAGAGSGANGSVAGMKRSRSSGLSKPCVPLYPTPLECWSAVRTAVKRHREEAGAALRERRVVRRRRRALATVDTPLHAFAVIENALTRERTKLRRALNKRKGIQPGARGVGKTGNRTPASSPPPQYHQPTVGPISSPSSSAAAAAEEKLDPAQPVGLCGSPQGEKDDAAHVRKQAGAQSFGVAPDKRNAVASAAHPGDARGATVFQQRRHQKFQQEQELLRQELQRQQQQQQQQQQLESQRHLDRQLQEQEQEQLRQEEPQQQQTQLQKQEKMQVGQEQTKQRQGQLLQQSPQNLCVQEANNSVMGEAPTCQRGEQETALSEQVGIAHISAGKEPREVQDSQTLPFGESNQHSLHNQQCDSSLPGGTVSIGVVAPTSLKVGEVTQPPSCGSGDACLKGAVEGLDAGVTFAPTAASAARVASRTPLSTFAGATGLAAGYSPSASSPSPMPSPSPSPPPDGVHQLPMPAGYPMASAPAVAAAAAAGLPPPNPRLAGGHSTSVWAKPATPARSLCTKPADNANGSAPAVVSDLPDGIASASVPQYEVAVGTDSSVAVNAPPTQLGKGSLIVSAGEKETGVTGCALDRGEHRLGSLSEIPGSAKGREEVAVTWREAKPEKAGVGFSLSPPDVKTELGGDTDPQHIAVTPPAAQDIAPQPSSSQPISKSTMLLEQAYADFEDVEQFFRSRAKRFLYQLRSLATQANCPTTRPFNFCNIEKDFLKVRKEEATDATKRRDRKESVGVYIQRSVDASTYPALSRSFALRPGYRLHGGPIGSGEEHEVEPMDEVDESGEQPRSPTTPRGSPGIQSCVDSDDSDEANSLGGFDLSFTHFDRLDQRRQRCSPGGSKGGTGIVRNTGRLPTAAAVVASVGVAVHREQSSPSQLPQPPPPQHSHEQQGRLEQQENHLQQQTYVSPQYPVAAPVLDPIGREQKQLIPQHLRGGEPLGVVGQQAGASPADHSSHGGNQISSPEQPTLCLNTASITGRDKEEADRRAAELIMSASPAASASGVAAAAPSPQPVSGSMDSNHAGVNSIVAGNAMGGWACQPLKFATEPNLSPPSGSQYLSGTGKSFPYAPIDGQRASSVEGTPSNLATASEAIGRPFQQPIQPLQIATVAENPDSPAVRQIPRANTDGVVVSARSTLGPQSLIMTHAGAVPTKSIQASQFALSASRLSGQISQEAVPPADGIHGPAVIGSVMPTSLAVRSRPNEPGPPSRDVGIEEGAAEENGESVVSSLVKLGADEQLEFSQELEKSPGPSQCG